jgi:DNA-cytosine methyltransferase
MLKLLDLFSGIGGFSLGLESTGGFETIAFVEKDDFCQKVLKKHWPNTTIEGDIRNVKGDKYEADIITGGFPCQPFSVAGKRKGTDDDRYLWDETIRVVRECKPRWFIGENVEGLININNGLVLRQVQTDLEKEGFEVQCLVIPASGIGAWHQRKRIWIVGYTKHNGHSSTKIRTSNDKTKNNSEKRKNETSEFERTSRSKNNGNVWMDVSNSDGNRTQWNKSEDWKRWWFESFNNSEDVSNSESISSNDGRYGNDSKEKQIQLKTRRKSSSTNVPNSNDTGSGRGRISGNIDEQRWNTFETKREGIQSKNKKTCSDDIKQNGENVSNSNNTRNRTPKYDIDGKWEKINERWKELSQSKSNRYSEDVSNPNDRFSIGENKEIQTRRNTSSSSSSNGTKETWWQTQSRICGVPNGVSFELDKNRNNRIKSLGNSIVPQIVRELGLAILQAENTK